jgi:tetratricopeptide (TPR) repeat protein
MKQQTKWMALVLVLALFMPACTFVNKLQARDELNKGVKAFGNQDYKTAIDHFNKAVAKDPAFVIPLSYKATAYSAMFVPGSQTEENVGNANEAIKTFQQVLNKEPNNINAIVNIAAIYYQLGDYDKSREWCRKILAKDNRNAEAQYRIGVINYEIVNKSTGMLGENVESMLSSDKDRDLKLIAEGIKALDDAIKIKPDYFDAMHYLNLMYREEAKFAKDSNEKNTILLKADSMALKAMELEKRYKEMEKNKRVIKTDKK